MAKKARRTYNRTTPEERPQQNTNGAAAAFGQMLANGMANAAARTRTTTDSRSNVLSACTLVLNGMNESLQIIARAAIEAPNYNDIEERN